MSNRQDEQYFRDAANKAGTKELALTAFGIYAGLKMARDPDKPAKQDILSTLRFGHAEPIADEHYAQAADEIERLRTENQRHKAAAAFWKATARRFAQARRIALSSQQRGEP